MSARVAVTWGKVGQLLSMTVLKMSDSKMFTGIILHHRILLNYVTNVYQGMAYSE